MPGCESLIRSSASFSVALSAPDPAPPPPVISRVGTCLPIPNLIYRGAYPASKPNIGPPCWGGRYCLQPPFYPNKAWARSTAGNSPDDTIKSGWGGNACIPFYPNKVWARSIACKSPADPNRVWAKSTSGNSPNDPIKSGPGVMPVSPLFIQ